MLPKRLIGIRALFVRVTLIIVALALLPTGRLDARGAAVIGFRARDGRL